MSSQTALLIPPGVQEAELTNHIVNYSYSELIIEIAEAGFKTIELSGDLAILLPHFYSKESIKSLLKLKKELDLSYTVHLPLWSVEPSTSLQPVRKGSVEALINHIDLVKTLEPEVYVLHATGALAAEFYRMSLPEVAKTFLLGQFKENAISSIGRILSETGISRQKLAIETIEFPLDLTIDIANQLDISLCFDTGHIMAGFSGNNSFFDALSSCFHRVAEFHLHDCPQRSQEDPIGYGQDHKPLGHGDINIVQLLNQLESHNFDGPIIFEMSLDDAKESIDFIKTNRPNTLI